MSSGVANEGTTGALDAGLVERWFLRALSRWLLIKATEVGGYLVKVLDGRPRKLGEYPHSNAHLSVDRAGEKRAAWAKATNSAGVAEWTAVKLWWSNAPGIGTRVGGGADAARLRCQRPDVGVWTPVRSSS